MELGEEERRNARNIRPAPVTGVSSIKKFEFGFSFHECKIPFLHHLFFIGMKPPLGQNLGGQNLSDEVTVGSCGMFCFYPAFINFSHFLICYFCNGPAGEKLKQFPNFSDQEG